MVALIKADLSTRKIGGRRVTGFLEGGVVRELLLTNLIRNMTQEEWLYLETCMVHGE